jgi:hypothetical protein
MNRHSLASLTLLASCLACSPVASAQSVVQEITLPADKVRLFLPGDGHVFSETITPNVWTDHNDPFERHETIEVAFGRALRAQQDDRKHEYLMIPGIAFKEGFLAVQGGWRAKKKTDWHRDYYDGTFEGQVVMAFARGAAHVESNVELKWNGDFTLLIPGVAWLVQGAADKLERQIEADVNTKLAGEINTAVKTLIEAGTLPPEAVNRVAADITPHGVRIRVFDRPVEVRRVRMPHANIQPPAGGTDKEFGGNGPNMKIIVGLRTEANKVVMGVDMKAWESGKKPGDRGYTQAFEYREFDVAVAGATVLGLVGRREWWLIDEQMRESVHARRTAIGRLVVYGDRDGKDAGDYTRMELATDLDAIVLVAPH